MSSVYERMKARGVNMSWYEKGKRGRQSSAVALDDDQCSALSIYLLKEDGSLWTVDYKGAAYHKVRPAGKKQARQVYVCACCKQQWNEAPIGDISKAIEHGEKDTTL